MTTQDSLLDYCGTQARLIGDMIEPWKAEHEGATVAHALDMMFPLIVEGCALLRESFPQLKRNLFIACQRGESVLSLGSKYYEGFRTFIDDSEALLSSARELLAEGFEFSTLAGAEEAIRGFRQFFDAEVDQLPRIDLEAIARSTEEYERGEYRSAREVMDELRRQAH